MGGTSYEQKTAKVAKGDILILYTDGITEAMNKKRFQYGMDRLQEIVKLHKDKTMDELCKLIYDDINKFVDGAPQHDDQTLFMSKVL